jgi:hypothetical protein
VPDLGPPASYLTLEPGTPVFSSDSESLGKVEHVLADLGSDIFDGLVIDRSVLPGGHRFVDADQVDEIYEGGVALKLDREAAASLPEPGEGPATLAADPGEEAEGPLEDKLRRAWELISGKR